MIEYIIGLDLSISGTGICVMQRPHFQRIRSPETVEEQVKIIHTERLHCPLNADASHWEHTHRLLRITDAIIDICATHCIVGPPHYDKEWIKEHKDWYMQRVRTAIDQTAFYAEGYAFGAAYQAHQLGEVGGAVMIRLAEYTKPLIRVPASSIRKLLVGFSPSKANKCDPKKIVHACVSKVLFNTGSTKPITYDESDAVAVANYGCSEEFGSCLSLGYTSAQANAIKAPVPVLTIKKPSKKKKKS
jgi:Holliday junction resolvasome RuvABC endonuclease subunit